MGQTPGRGAGHTPGGGAGQTPSGKAWQPSSQRQSAGPPASPGRKLARAGRGEGAGGACGWGAEQEVGVAH